MFRKIFIIGASVVVALLALFLIAAALQPDDFSVERSATFDASPAALFAQVNDHRNFVKWNPFNELDPDVKNTFSGTDSGVGAVCYWKGNSRTGAGSSTIIESKPNELVRLRMDFKEPMENTSTVDFTFKPEGDKTLVTWKMYGPQNFVGKAFSLVMSTEKMCGPMFEKGLASMEKSAKQTTLEKP